MTDQLGAVLAGTISTVACMLHCPKIQTHHPAAVTQPGHSTNKKKDMCNARCAASDTYPSPTLMPHNTDQLLRRRALTDAAVAPVHASVTATPAVVAAMQ